MLSGSTQRTPEGEALCAEFNAYIKMIQDRLQIELGLQTSNEQTGRLINRCYTNQDYLDTVARIKKVAPDIHIVTHLIFGLPGETEQDMLNSVKIVIVHMV